ncbi:NADH-dependent flavin oxidoreductase [Pseudomonas silvicola]|nr:NADH-dependent flavin oxidoreductase [Pseudomonas silvicola]
MKTASFFQPFELAPGLPLRNRIVMAPMTTWASNTDGTVSDEEIAYYRLRAQDVGLVITGCTHVHENGVGFTGEFAAHDDSFIPSLKNLAAAAKSGGAPAILQIFHAGVKTRPDLVPEIVAASAVTGDAGPFAPAMTPRAMDEAEILDVIRSFGETTRRAIEAGFDGVELHGAHGFLLQNFLSPHFNIRQDRWGGSLEGRMRFPIAVVQEVNRVIEEHADRPFALGYRISLEESHEDGLRLNESMQFVDRLVETGITYLHASLGNALEDRPIGDDEGRTLVDIVSGHLGARIPMIAAGQIRTPKEAESAIAAGLSLVAVGQGLVMNPDWLLLARTQQEKHISLDIAASDVSRIAIPPKLWKEIEGTVGWFNVRAS